MTIADLRCLFVILRCLLSDKDVRCALLFYFEEEMVAMLGEGQSVDTHFCQWLISISINSTFGGVSNISIKKYRL